MQITRKQHQYQHQPGKTILVCLRDDENEHHNEQHKHKQKEKEGETERERGNEMEMELLLEERTYQRSRQLSAKAPGLKALSCRLYAAMCVCVCV